MARRRTHEVAEIDVVPVMSLIVHLIPMLLLSARFVILAQNASQGPVVPSSPAPSQGALAEQDRKIVSVRVTPDGFVVGGSDAADPRIPCQGPCAPDGYDFTALNQAMIVAKRSHPGENRVVIAADPSIPYAVLIGVMDATRAERDGARRPLFPSPLIAAPEAR